MPEASVDKSRASLKKPRALIVKLGAIGDVVMAIPAVRTLHESGYQVEWLCGRAVEPLLRLYPWIHLLPVDDGTILAGGKVERLSAIAGVWKLLAGRRYDLCATLYYDARYKVLTLPVRAARKFTLSHTDRARRLVPGRHHTDEYARILLDGADECTPARLLPLPPDALPASPLARTPGRERAVLVPAGSKNLLRNDGLRRWPVENYVAVAEALLARGMEVVLLGGPGDLWASPAFAGRGVNDLIGKLPLVESLGLLASADVVVSHDTGPLHLAGLTDAALVSMFGPTSPHVFHPQRPGTVALWGGEGFACRPCYDGRDFAPCPDNGCVQQITPGHVLEQVDALLEARRAGFKPPVRVLTLRTMRDSLVQLQEGLRL